MDCTDVMNLDDETTWPERLLYLLEELLPRLIAYEKEQRVLNKRQENVFGSDIP